MIFHLVLIAVPFMALFFFLNLVAFEERRGNRIILADKRYYFDQRASRAFFVAKHVDWGAFMYELTRSSIERAVHDIAHTSLIVVRVVERQLTRLVRTLRSRRDEPLLSARSSDRPSGFQRAIGSVRKIVRRTRKQTTIQFPSQKRDNE